MSHCYCATAHCQNDSTLTSARAALEKGSYLEAEGILTHKICQLLEKNKETCLITQAYLELAKALSCQGKDASNALVMAKIFYVTGRKLVQMCTPVMSCA